eukprot:CAMPEP_0115852246 /NCGR_PEP_ID=MMETSP0287-20121206/12899_1 /TAXON_ID=412157 /ORGANISM="Chrysochromulina rotalis, Strain UIO044" /LENGTH=152 /DNA_ID=CAMNT_0003306305 /DNA_START=468 /DNA_END=927 /DNA_ORIENTATION=+
MTSRKCSTSSVAIEAIDTCRVHTRPSTKEGERHNGGHEPSQPSDHMAADLDEVAPCTPRMYRCGSALAPVPHSTTTNEAIGTASGQSARAILAQMRRAPREVDPSSEYHLRMPVVSPRGERSLTGAGHFDEVSRSVSGGGGGRDRVDRVSRN